MLAVRCTQNVQGRRFQRPRFGVQFAQALIESLTDEGGGHAMVYIRSPNKLEGSNISQRIKTSHKS